MANRDVQVVADNLLLVERLRMGDEAAFSSLLELYSPALIRLAMVYVMDREVAEEVVQDTWLGVIRGLDRFQGRSSLKTWIFRILINIAKTRSLQEVCYVPFSSLSDEETEAQELKEVPDRLNPVDEPQGRHWVSSASDWGENPEKHLLSQETQGCIYTAINELSPRQRIIITLRDIEGWSAQEVCALLGISEANQRVLLHRARVSVRRKLELYFNERDGVSLANSCQP